MIHDRYYGHRLCGKARKHGALDNMPNGSSAFPGEQGRGDRAGGRWTMISRRGQRGQRFAIVLPALFLFFIGCGWVAAGDQESPSLEIECPMNIAPFGEVTKWDDTGKDYGVLWEDPREIHRVVVTFAGDPPPRDTLALEYWQSSWPHHEIPRDAPSGAGQSGWLNVGDWFQGEWKTADTDLEVNGNVCTFTFHALNE